MAPRLRLTDHARQRCCERGITDAQLMECLDWGAVALRPDGYAKSYTLGRLVAIMVECRIVTAFRVRTKRDAKWWRQNKRRQAREDRHSRKW